MLVLVIGRERRARVWEYVVGETEMRIWVVGIDATSARFGISPCGTWKARTRSGPCDARTFNAVAAADATDKLGLHNLRHKQWFSQSACANADDGFLESGLDLSHTLVVEMKQSRQSVFPFAMFGPSLCSV